MPVSLGLDLGRSGHTALAVVGGDNWRLRLINLDRYDSISAPEVETFVLRAYAQFAPQVIIIERNGPGGVFAELIAQRNPGIPIFAPDMGHPPIDLELWEGTQFIPDEYLNIRAEMYFILHSLLKYRRLKFPHEDSELFAQLSATEWEFDRTKAEKIKIKSKKGMQIHDNSSELEGIDFSRSPDKADALALACFGYALIAGDALSEETQTNDVIDPAAPGIFNIGQIDLEEL